ncbi:glycosyltransferase family 2 protein [Nioella sp. MMSF_3534]|uniref:glycosyltransferase family 2 protein n=1 Tax=Nioella sp. MMSF_3534 TaxID=3046720 RepID=UPI00273E9E25|nr:glycosyltransferase family 2 protein [Nioella sp. MMSF_3534]
MTQAVRQAYSPQGTAKLRVVPDARPPLRKPRLAQLLFDRGAITAEQMHRALVSQRHRDLPIGEILVTQGAISEAQLLDALAEQSGTKLLPEDHPPPDPALAGLLPAGLAIRLNAVPLRRAGSALVIMTNRPDRADEIRAALSDHDGPVLLALASRERMQIALTGVYGNELARIAEARTPGPYSCRDWDAPRAFRRWLAVLLAVCGALLLAPGAVVAGLCALGVLIAAVNAMLKWLALHGIDLPPQVRQVDHAPPIHPSSALPVVTILLPLFNEPDIAGHLIRRVSRLDYPRELLDVILLIEEEDATTRNALTRAELPFWMRAVIVPPGQPRTKPRAMNYGLNFARGSIVGVYDAEDAPEPDQIRKVAQRFLEVPPDVACLQGQLDYYNPHHNWLSRCFTLEYATWFRLLLPGVSRLGLFVPLGGTTLFFRRSLLEEMGAWDAHNVTEDADLGLRLTRQGYRTEIIETTTYEEANAAVLPWVKQRSRWLKGYAMTWATHMRDPVQLWRDLGARRFLGLQAQLLGTVLGFSLAPVLWTLVVKVAGLPHPLDAYLTTQGYLGLAFFFVACQMLTFYAAWRAAALPRHRKLRLWIPILDVYFLLASAATLLGLAELLVKPFHWRKTAHGRFSQGGQATDLMQGQTLPASSFSRTSNAVDR